MKFNCPICNLSFDDVSPWIRHKNMCKLDQAKPARAELDRAKKVGVQTDRASPVQPAADIIVKQSNSNDKQEVKHINNSDNGSCEARTAYSRCCTKCKVTKPLTSFYKDKYRCKECMKVDVVCTECRKVLRKNHIARHMKSVHGVPRSP